MLVFGNLLNFLLRWSFDYKLGIDGRCDNWLLKFLFMFRFRLNFGNFLCHYFLSILLFLSSFTSSVTYFGDIIFLCGCLIRLCFLFDQWYFLNLLFFNFLLNRSFALFLLVFLWFCFFCFLFFFMGRFWLFTWLLIWLLFVDVLQ